MPIRYVVDGTTYDQYLYTSRSSWDSECSSNPYIKVVKGGTTYYAALTTTAPTSGKKLRIPVKISNGTTDYYPLACAVRPTLEYEYSTGTTVDIAYPSNAFTEEQTMEYELKGAQGGSGRGGGGSGSAHCSNVVIGFHYTVAHGGPGGNAGRGFGPTPTAATDNTLDDNLTPGTTYQLVVPSGGGGGDSGGAGGAAENLARLGPDTARADDGETGAAGDTGGSAIFKIKNGATLYSGSGSVAMINPLYSGFPAYCRQSGVSNNWACSGDGGSGGAPYDVRPYPDGQQAHSYDAYNYVVEGGAAMTGYVYNSRAGYIVGGHGGRGGTAKTESLWTQDSYAYAGSNGSNGQTGAVGYGYVKIDYWEKGA